MHTYRPILHHYEDIGIRIFNLRYHIKEVRFHNLLEIAPTLGRFVCNLCSDRHIQDYIFTYKKC